jgi:hypothetical protein
MKPDKKTTQIFDIYGLYCPKSGELRYIGKANDAAKRLKSHIRDSRRRKTPVYDWFNKLNKEGLFPVCKVIQKTENWKEDEMRLIQISRARGDRLLNVADGGDEPFCSKETRAANGASVAKAIHSDPFRRRVWELKKTAMWLIKKGDANEEIKQKLRKSAIKRPDLFACFSQI